VAVPIKIENTIATKGTPGIQFTKGVFPREQITPASGVISGVVKGGADSLEGLNVSNYEDMFDKTVNGLTLIDITVKALPGGDAYVWGRYGQDPDKDLVWFSIREGSTQVKLWNSPEDKNVANIVVGPGGPKITPRYVTVPLLTIEWNPLEKVIYSDEIPDVATQGYAARGTLNRNTEFMNGQKFYPKSLKYMGVKLVNKRNSWIYHHVFQWRQVWMTNRWQNTPTDRMYWQESLIDENGNPYLRDAYPASQWNRIH
tara:strand:- start:8274 stop:9044 length:771 start_codon:yes stop_codon:yes gene_type:complete